MSDFDSQMQRHLERQKTFQRQSIANLSGEERIQRMVALQDELMAVLRSSPEGWAAFTRRNYHERRARLVDGVWQPVSPDRPISPS
jgi:hypothetical protein